MVTLPDQILTHELNAAVSCLLSGPFVSGLEEEDELFTR